MNEEHEEHHQRSRQQNYHEYCAKHGWCSCSQCSRKRDDYWRRDRREGLNWLSDRLFDQCSTGGCMCRWCEELRRQRAGAPPPKEAYAAVRDYMRGLDGLRFPGDAPKSVRIPKPDRVEVPNLSSDMIDALRYGVGPYVGFVTKIDATFLDETVLTEAKMTKNLYRVTLVIFPPKDEETGVTPPPVVQLDDVAVFGTSPDDAKVQVLIDNAGALKGQESMISVTQSQLSTLTQRQ